MPVRIYAFAKELGLDNKQLLDVCEKVNIQGKGSALASLDDNEVITIKEFLSGGGAKPEPPPAETGAPVRPAPFKPAPSKKKIGEIVTPVPKMDEVAEEVDVEEPETTAAEEVTNGTDVVEETPAPVVEEPAKKPPAKSKPGGSLLDRLKGKKATTGDKPAKPTTSKAASGSPGIAPGITPKPAPKRPMSPSPRRPGVIPRKTLKNLDQGTAGSS